MAGGRVDILGNTAAPTTGASNPVQVTDTILAYTSTTPSRRPLAVAGTEYSYTLPANSKAFEVRAAKKGTVNLAFASGQSGTNYVECFPGEVRRFGPYKGTSAITIYFQSDNNNDVLEVVSYS